MPLPDYPLTTAWLKDIYPLGLTGFPGCQSSTRLPMMIAEQYPTLPALPGLLPEWREALLQPLEPGHWIPETTAVLQLMLLREGFFSNDHDYLEATKKRIKASFLHPTIRPLMAVMSPHLLVLGASRRWAAYHKGSVLQVKSRSAKSLVGTLSYPAKLFSPLMIDDTRVALTASIELTGKSIETLTVHQTAPGLCAIEGRWQ